MCVWSCGRSHTHSYDQQQLLQYTNQLHATRLAQQLKDETQVCCTRLHEAINQTIAAPEWILRYALMLQISLHTNNLRAALRQHLNVLCRQYLCSLANAQPRHFSLNSACVQHGMMPALLAGDDDAARDSHTMTTNAHARFVMACVYTQALLCTRQNNKQHSNNQHFLHPSHAAAAAQTLSCSCCCRPWQHCPPQAASSSQQPSACRQH